MKNIAENQTFDTRRSLCFTEKKYQAQTVVVNKTFWKVKKCTNANLFAKFHGKHKVAFWTKLDWFNVMPKSFPYKVSICKI